MVHISEEGSLLPHILNACQPTEADMEITKRLMGMFDRHYNKVYYYNKMRQF